MPDPYQIGINGGSTDSPCNSGCNVQPHSAGDLNQLHNGRRIKVGSSPVSVLLEAVPLQGGFVKMLLAHRGTVTPFTVAGSFPIHLDPPQEVTGD